MIFKVQTYSVNIFTFVLKTGLGSERFCLMFQILIPEIWRKDNQYFDQVEKGEPASCSGVCSLL